MEPNNSQNIRDLLLSGKDDDVELTERPGDCFELQWSRDHWNVRVDHKRIYRITQDDVSEGVNLRDVNFVLNALGALKFGGVEALKSFLEGA